MLFPGAGITGWPRNEPANSCAMIDARRTDAGTLFVRVLLTPLQRRFSQITPPFPLMAQPVIQRLGAQPAPRVPIHEPARMARRYPIPAARREYVNPSPVSHPDACAALPVRNLPVAYYTRTPPFCLPLNPSRRAGQRGRHAMVRRAEWDKGPAGGGFALGRGGGRFRTDTLTPLALALPVMSGRRLVAGWRQWA